MTKLQLDARSAYPIWAATYDAETAVTALELALVNQLTAPSARPRVLDVGCGTGRRLRSAPTAALSAGIDLVPDMLAVARTRDSTALLAAADLRCLPLADQSFDLVWCRLAIGHVAELDAAYAELARVARVNATIVISDFHPAAAAAGHTRSFRSASGERVEVCHVLHDDTVHNYAAAAAGLSLETRAEGVVGPEVRHFYDQAGALERYHRDLGLPLVLLLAYRRQP